MNWTLLPKIVSECNWTKERHHNAHLGMVNPEFGDTNHYNIIRKCESVVKKIIKVIIQYTGQTISFGIITLGLLVRLSCFH